MKQARVAIVGATGAVGHELLRVLDERDFPVASLKLLASERSAGRTLRFRGDDLPVEAVAADAFRGVDVAFFSAGSGTSAAFAPLAVEAGCAVVDNSSAFRMRADVPLVVPEVNASALRSHQGIVANPNCSTIILVLALKPLDAAAGLDAVVVSTYQAASGAGQRAVDEMFEATSAALDGRELPAPLSLPKTLAFNLFPQVDVFMADGYTREEDKMLHEVRKVLGRPALAVDATCVRVPVARCHSESVSVRLSRALSAEDARAAFAAAPGLILEDEPAPQRIRRLSHTLAGTLAASAAFAPRAYSSEVSPFGWSETSSGKGLRSTLSRSPRPCSPKTARVDPSVFHPGSRRRAAVRAGILSQERVCSAATRGYSRPVYRSMAAKRSTKKKSSKKKPAVAARPAAKKKTSKRPSGATQPSGADDRLSQLERLVEMMVAKDVVEVELEERGARWRVRRTEPQAVTYAAAPPMAMPAALPGAVAGAAAPAVSGDTGEAAAEPQGEVFKSPMLGTFYSAPSPDAESFVKLGDR